MSGLGGRFERLEVQKVQSGGSRRGEKSSEVMEEMLLRRKVSSHHEVTNSKTSGCHA